MVLTQLLNNANPTTMQDTSVTKIIQAQVDSDKYRDIKGIIWNDRDAEGEEAEAALKRIAEICDRKDQTINLEIELTP